MRMRVYMRARVCAKFTREIKKTMGYKRTMAEGGGTQLVSADTKRN